MVKKSLLICALCSAILFLSSLDSSAGLFGPKKFERTAGSPDTYSETVSVCNTASVYKMTIENGEGGKDRVSSASITVNGAEVVKESEFSQKVDRIEKTLSLGADNTIGVKLSSGPGGFIKVGIDCASNCLGVKINSPATGAAINRSQAVVTGSLYNTYGETGVTFKSSGTGGEAAAPGYASGSGFAGVVPLQTGANTITATATDACGYQTRDTITVNTESADESVSLTVTPSSGVVPSSGSLEVTLEASVNISNVAGYSWDLNGDGAPEQEGAALSKVTASYANTGIYFPTVTVTDNAGNRYTGTAILNVMSKEELDTLLKGKWEGMKSILGQANVDKALKYFSSGSQKMYRYNFELMASILPQAVQEMGPIEPVNLEGEGAEYEMTVVQDGAQSKFPVFFLKDENGIWKIKFF